MKTKELIELLQKEDPSGECHVRLNDGEPILFAERKSGYWDGPYNYIEIGEDSKLVWVQSTKNDKVDINTLDLFGFAERYKGDWNEIKKHIRVEYGYLDDERENEFFKKAKNACDEYNEVGTKLYNMSLEEMTKNALKGWKWFQNKDVDKNEHPNIHKYYTWKIYDENNKEQVGSNLHMTEPVLLSGEWIKTDNKKEEGYYEWIYKNK